MTLVQTEIKVVQAKAIPLMLGMIPSVLRGLDVTDIERIKAITRATFPKVRNLSTTELEDKLSSNPEAILIIDTRSPQEFEVSHLKGALNLCKPREIVEQITRQAASTTLLYCSVGFRSSKLASAIQKSVSGEVFNLEGSIFEWANQGKQLYRGEAITTKVHPYGSRWSGLLKPGLSSL